METVVVDNPKIFARIAKDVFGPLGPSQLMVIQYLFENDEKCSDQDGFVAPTSIGVDVASLPKDRASSWASSVCKRLVDRGIMDRSRNGHYRLKHHVVIGIDQAIQSNVCPHCGSLTSV